MEAIKPTNIVAFVVASVILAGGATACCAESDLKEPNALPLVSLGEQENKLAYLAEAVRWPEFDFNNVTRYVCEPNSLRRATFASLVSRIIDPNYLPEKFLEKIHFLKGWRGKQHENFVAQYETGPYRIRVKSQVTTTATSRVWTSDWIVMAIQTKNNSVFVSKSDLSAVVNFTDQFLSKEINSSVQDYAGISNMDEPVFKKMDTGYFLSYAVKTKLPMHGPCIWTDGHTVIICLKVSWHKKLPAPQKEPP